MIQMLQDCDRLISVAHLNWVNPHLRRHAAIRMALTPSATVLQEVFIEYFAGNRGSRNRKDHYGVEVVLISSDPLELDLVLTFKAGERYCCFESGCHHWLFVRSSWERLRDTLKARGLGDLPPLTIRKLIIRVEREAIGTVYKTLGADEVAQREYEYAEGPIREGDAKDG